MSCRILSRTSDRTPSRRRARQPAATAPTSANLPGSGMAVLEAQQAFGRFNGSKETELLAWLRRMLLNNVVTFRRHWEQTAKRRGKPRGVDGGDSTTAGVQ